MDPRTARMICGVILFCCLTHLGARPLTAEPYVYVTNLVPAKGTVSVIDAARNAVVARIPVGSEPDGVAVSPDGRRVYVANFQSGSVSVIDTATMSVVATVGVGSNPVGVAVTPDGARVYVVNRGADSVSVLDTRSDTVVAEVGVGGGPNAVAASPRGPEVYVTNSGSEEPGTVSVIDDATLTVSETIPVHRRPNRVATAPDGRIYVTNFRSWNVSVLDGQSHEVITTIRVLGRPSGIAVNPNGAAAYVVTLQGEVNVIHTTTNQVRWKIQAGNNPWGIAVSRNGGRGYVADLATGRVAVLDLGPEELIDTVEAGEMPFAVAVGCAGRGCTEEPYTPRPTRTVTATPLQPGATRTPTATATRDSAYPAPASVTVGKVAGHPGDRVEVEVFFHTEGALVVGVQLDVHFDDFTRVVARSNGRPDCMVNPSLGKNGTAFAFQPPPCTPSDNPDCQSVRAFVLSLVDVDPIPDGSVLFTCRLDVARDAPPGVHQLGVTKAAGSDAAGGIVPLEMIAGAVVVGSESSSHATAPAAGEPSWHDRLCAGGPLEGLPCEAGADCPRGVCTRTQGVCDGGFYDGLLCDCPSRYCKDCLAGTCVPTQRICETGIAKGLACLQDSHCGAARCISTRKVCTGGDFDWFACVDHSDCPLGACSGVRASEPDVPTPAIHPSPSPSPAQTLGSAGTSQSPTSTPEAASSDERETTVPRVGAAGGGCSVTSTARGGDAWLLLMGVLALLQIRHGTGRLFVRRRHAWTGSHGPGHGR